MPSAAIVRPGCAAALASLLLVLLGACSSGPTIRSDVDPTADFANYRTFAFYEPFGLDRDGVRTPLGNLVREAVTRELSRRGLQLAGLGADLQVNAGGMVTERQRVDTVPGGHYGYYGYRGSRYGGWPAYDEVVVTNYQEGSITIDLVDPVRSQMVWSSTAVDRVTEADRARRDELLPALIGEMFSSFPIRPEGGS